MTSVDGNCVGIEVGSVVAGGAVSAPQPPQVALHCSAHHGSWQYEALSLVNQPAPQAGFASSHGVVGGQLHRPRTDVHPIPQGPEDIGVVWGAVTAGVSVVVERGGAGVEAGAGGGAGFEVGLGSLDHVMPASSPAAVSAATIFSKYASRSASR